MRIVVVACNTWWNKGDAAMLSVMDVGLRQRLPGVELTYSTRTPELDTEHLGLHCIRQPPRLNGRLTGAALRLGERVSPRLLGAAVTGQSLARVTRASAWVASGSPRHGIGSSMLPRAMRRVVRVVEEHDAVVAAPGGYLGISGPGDVDWQYAAAPLLMAPRLGRPVFLAPCSFGPFTAAQRLVADRVASGARLVLLREPASLPWVQRSGIAGSLVHVVADLAWLQGPEPLAPALDALLARPSGGSLVGFAVRDFAFPAHADPSARRAAYLGALAAAADSLSERMGSRLVFVPQVSNPRRPDIAFAREVVASMRHRDAAVVIDDDLSPGQLVSVYGQLDALVATRMHAAILAMSTGTPAVTIAYAHKTTGIMGSLGRSDDVANIGTVRAEWLLERVQAAMGLDRARLDESTSILKRAAVHGLDLLAEAIGREARAS